MGLQIYITGGTFDKVYNPISEKLEFTETHIPEILRSGRNAYNVSLETLMLKDSLYMTDEDRQFILEKCQNCLEGRILIAHGTGTMIETAGVLGQNLRDKTVVLIGAMVPYSIFDSDAVFNFAFGYGIVQVLPNGTYIAMNGRIFDWDNVRKNPKTGEFETIK